MSKLYCCRFFTNLCEIVKLIFYENDEMCNFAKMAIKTLLASVDYREAIRKKLLKNLWMKKFGSFEDDGMKLIFLVCIPERLTINLLSYHILQNFQIFDTQILENFSSLFF